LQNELAQGGDPGLAEREVELAQSPGGDGVADGLAGRRGCREQPGLLRACWSNTRRTTGNLAYSIGASLSGRRVGRWWSDKSHDRVWSTRFKPYLVRRIGDGRVKVSTLYREITAQGFTGSYPILRKFVEQ
jgi:hypothetical protein